MKILEIKETDELEITLSLTEEDRRKIQTVDYERDEITSKIMNLITKSCGLFKHDNSAITGKFE